MADSVNKILWKFFGDTRDLDKSLKKTQRGFKDTQKAGGKVSTAFSGIKRAAVGLGAALGARELVQFAGEAMQLAVAADEVDSKFQAVYGSATDLQAALREWGNMAGVTETQAKDLAATFGNLAIAQGVSEDATQKLVVDVATLAGDMASFNDADPAMVFNDLNKALLTTEREGMKKYGIAVTEAEVKTRAMEIAVADGRSEVTQADRAMASYEIVVRQAGKAVGDLERTQDSAANRQRQLNASLKEAKEAFGRPLLRAVDEFSRSLDASGDGMADMGESAGELLVKLESLSDVITSVNGVLDDETSNVDKAKLAWNGFVETGAAVLPRLLGIEEALKFTVQSSQDLAAASADVTHSMAASQGIIGGWTSDVGDAAVAADALGDEASEAASAVSILAGGMNLFDIGALDEARRALTPNVTGQIPGLVGGPQEGFASGGVVPGQRGKPRMAVVHGGERITRPGQDNGGAAVIVNFNGVVGDPVAVAQQIRDLLDVNDQTGG